MIKNIKHKMEMRKYNDYNIGDYFRKIGCHIGENNRILIRDLGSEPYLIKIGNNCTIAQGVYFVTHDGAAGLFRKEIPNINVFGKIELKDNVFIGINCIIMPNVTIGPNAVVGAGAVVTKDVPANSVVAGVPAKVLCTMDEYKKKCRAEWEKLNLQGSRSTWQKQLEEHFWHHNNNT
jgi:acetyltransferase-like isoleucine patch superfamily enzyme